MYCKTCLIEANVLQKYFSYRRISVMGGHVLVVFFFHGKTSLLELLVLWKHKYNIGQISQVGMFLGGHVVWEGMSYGMTFHTKTRENILWNETSYRRMFYVITCLMGAYALHEETSFIIT